VSVPGGSPFCALTNGMNAPKSIVKANMMETDFPRTAPDLLLRIFAPYKNRFAFPGSLSRTKRAPFLRVSHRSAIRSSPCLSRRHFAASISLSSISSVGPHSLSQLLAVSSDGLCCERPVVPKPSEASVSELDPVGQSASPVDSASSRSVVFMSECLPHREGMPPARHQESKHTASLLGAFDLDVMISMDTAPSLNLFRQHLIYNLVIGYQS